MSLPSRLAWAALLLFGQACAFAANDATPFLTIPAAAPGSFAAGSAATGRAATGSDTMASEVTAGEDRGSDAQPPFAKREAEGDDDGPPLPRPPRGSDDPPHRHAPSASPVPEPGTAGMLGSGVLLVAAWALWRRRGS